jgi:hypothetical protein
MRYALIALSALFLTGFTISLIRADNSLTIIFGVLFAVATGAAVGTSIDHREHLKGNNE